ncbi:MAG: hypothetical protein BA863_06680 [Desulfovibrio sp. S3730MH75]|nr:MAG: hypothetical protein BA863_06680 [Desulfovibrio sp. S3730MH75]
MIELIEIDSSKAVGFKISGKIEEKDMKLVIDTVNEKLKYEEKLAIYVELVEFGGISLKALVEDIKFAFPNMKKFTKKAVVSDKSWHETLTEISDKLFPFIELKHFGVAEKEKAKLWVME